MYASCAVSTSLAVEPNWTDDDLLQQPGVVSAEFIFEEAPFPQCHASTIVETPTGLVAAWFGGTREKHPDVGIWLSRHDDGRWTPPVEVANGVQSPTLRHPTWNPVLFQPKDGAAAPVLQSRPDAERLVGHADDIERRRPDVVAAAAAAGRHPRADQEQARRS